MSRVRPRAAVLLAALLLGLLLGPTLAGCSSDTDPDGSRSTAGPMMSGGEPPDTTGAVSAADVRFLRTMMPLQRQAVAMSDLAVGAGASPAVQALADRVAVSQTTMLGSVRACLAGWRRSKLGGMSMMSGWPGSMMVPGMMSGSRMSMLARLHGARFDDRFLSLMRAHHRAVIDAADEERASGSNPQARALARRMSREMGAELLMMHGVATP